MSGKYNEFADLSHAELAGFSKETAQVVHDLSLQHHLATGRPYWEIERALVQFMVIGAKHEENNHKLRVNMTDLEYYLQTQDPKTALIHEKLNKYSQKGHPGLGIYKLTTDAGTIMKAKEVVKSSKNKHPKNYTPPKKKRK